MDTKQLKDKILELAIRGKLVEQDPTDEPASILLQKIAEEKERLVAEKVIKKSKPLPEITEDEIPFEIPNSWEWVRLGDIGEAQTGTTPSTKHPEYFNGEVPFIKPADINEYGINYYNESLSNEGVKKGRLIKSGSVMMVCIGGSIGKCYYTDRDTSCNQQINTLTGIEALPVELIYCFLKTSYFQKEVIKKSTGTATPIIKKSLWESIILPLPPLTEQRRIVQKIEELFALIDSLEGDRDELLKIVKHTREKVLEEAIKGKLVEQDPEDEPASILLQRIAEEKERLVAEKVIKKSKPLPEITEDEIPFEIPESWEWVRLGDVSYNFGQKKPEKEFTYIDVTSINNKLGKLKDELIVIKPEQAPSRARKIVKDGTIIYSTVRPYLLNMTIINDSFDFEPIASTAFAVMHTFEEVSNRFLFYYLRSKSFTEYTDSQMVGMAYPAINDKNLFNGLFPLPPLAEQCRIVQKVDAIMELCDSLEEQLL